MGALLLNDIPLKDHFEYSFNVGDEMSRCTFFAFNTVVEITFAAEGHSSEDIARMTFELCRKFEWLFSHKLDGSELTRLNRAKGDIVEVPRELWEVLQAGKRYSRLSRGCFDITMGAVTCLWDFTLGHLPDAEELASALVHVDYNLVILWKTEEEGSAHYFVQLADPQTKIDLGGVAKGYIADKLVDLLRDQGASCAFINLGGNVAVFGLKPNRMPWTIGLRNPFEEGILGSFSLAEGSVVTSSDAERVFDSEGERFHHILDLRSGMPVKSDLTSVTLISKRSVVGDGLSTTLFIWGFERAFAYVEKLADCEALFVKRDGTIKLTKGAKLKRLE